MKGSRIELVEQAIRFRSPERVPIVFWNRDQTEGDVMLYHLALGAPGNGTPNGWNWRENEWGYRLESLRDGTRGHPVEPFNPDLPTPKSIPVPALRESERMSADFWFPKSYTYLLGHHWISRASQ